MGRAPAAMSDHRLKTIRAFSSAAPQANRLSAKYFVQTTAGRDNGHWLVIRARDGAVGHMIARRRYPLIGDAGGRSSFVHVDDAVQATVTAQGQRDAKR